jgi:DNA repair exonuclease SbcCD ATPase subunit
MNPDNRLQLLQLSLAKMTVLLHEALADKMQDQLLSAELREEPEKLSAELKVVREEYRELRDHDNRLIWQLKEILQRTEGELASSQRQRQRADHQAMIEAEKTRTWRERFEIVDDARRDSEAEIICLRREIQRLNSTRNTDIADRQEIMTITDVQACPECNEQQLVHIVDQVYECLYCDQTFSLEW